MSSGTLYILPSPLDPDLSPLEIPSISASVLRSLSVFVCENSKTTRKVIKKLGHPLKQSDIEVFQINKHDPGEGIELFISRLKDGEHIGFMSEAGLPGVADPGSYMVSKAHENNIPVQCLPGSNSLVMALSGSGLNGQKFCFQGYLPREKAQRADTIRRIEKLSEYENSSQIIIETPYRNDQLIKDLTKTLDRKTRLCIASGLNTTSQRIRTLTSGDWSKSIPEIGKVPAVFIIYAGDRNYLN